MRNTQNRQHVMENTRITIQSKEYGPLNFSGKEEAREYVTTFKNSGGEPARIAEEIEKYLADCPTGDTDSPQRPCCWAARVAELKDAGIYARQGESKDNDTQ